MRSSTWTVWWAAWLLGSLSCCAFAEITIDGDLGEPEWTQARIYAGFRVTQPLLLDEPPYITRARVLATPQGLVFSVECAQPYDLRVRGRSQRDALEINADAVSVVVDFDGSGSTGYEFTVTLSGSVRDGMILQQNRLQYAWDGVWYSAVRETDVGWQIEMLLPWSIAPMGPIRNDLRKIGFYVARDMRARALRFAYPAVPPQSPSFVADLYKLEVAAFEPTALTVTPYGAISRDLLQDTTDVRGGADFTWRPTAQQQLTAALNPDFGQIESDDLLVNFSAVETFVPDQRPFFTENQQLFDVRTTLQDRLIHTKRIGAAPDAGPESNSQVLGAAKYLWTRPAWELGAFVAAEDDSTLAEGRTFAAARSRWRTASGSLGYLGTFTDRPTLGRRVFVHSADAEWLPASGWRLAGQLVTTQPSNRSQRGSSDQAGFGTLAKLEYAGAAPLVQTLYVTWYDRHYDTTDMGFMERNSLREVWSQTRWYYRREYPKESRLLEMQWHFDGRARMNGLGERLPWLLQMGPYWRYRDSSSLWIYAQPATAGIDDLSSRGHGSFILPPQHEANVSFLSGPARAFQWYSYFKMFREGLEHYGWEAQLKPSWWLGEDLKVGLTLTYRDSPDWIIWRPEEQRMVGHERELLQTALNAEWFPNARSEVRLKLQWTGLHARGTAAYDIGDTRHLVASSVPPSDFSHSELALQVRLRYELKPLSDLYVAYTFGGLAHEQEERTLGQLWNASIDTRTGHQLMIKLAYRL